MTSGLRGQMTRHGVDKHTPTTKPSRSPKVHPQVVTHNQKVPQENALVIFMSLGGHRFFRFVLVFRFSALFTFYPQETPNGSRNAVCSFGRDLILISLGMSSDPFKLRASNLFISSKMGRCNWRRSVGVRHWLQLLRTLRVLTRAHHHPASQHPSSYPSSTHTHTHISIYPPHAHTNIYI